MSIEGFWFESENSTRQGASLAVSDGCYRLELSGQVWREGALAELVVSDRLGNLPRRLSWPDGALFETGDNDILDEWLSDNGHKGSGSLLLHRVESSWKWVAMAVFVTVIVSYVGIRFGLPAASESIARQLPESVNDSISKQALAAMDRFVFDETEVSAARQAEVQQQFDELISQLPQSDIDFTLHFRSMKGISNAMALPGGDVVVTDDFLELVEHPQELDSVLLHEIGHVVEYHGMTQVIRASAMSVIVTLAFGDLNALGELAVGIPVFIMQNSYSQAAETEADHFAFERMREMGKDPRHFADIILRLTKEELDEAYEPEDGPAYFSSHPDSQARALKALEFSEAMASENN